MVVSEDPGGVWCRKCGSLEYSTTRTYPCLEGVLRVHKCGICGESFGSIATYFDPKTPKGDGSGRFTRLSDVLLPVQAKP